VKKTKEKDKILSNILNWCAIGDSFTYLNDHLEETGFRVEKGYLTRTQEKLKFPVNIYNLGVNGSSTTDWLDIDLITADFYTVLLGTNDWFSRHTPTGDKLNYEMKTQGTILGNLACIIAKIRNYSATAPIFVMNPVERGDFVYIENPANNAHGSYAPESGQMLSDIANDIYTCVRGENIYTIDLHGRSGFTPENAVHFKRLRKNGILCDIQYPDYVGVPYNQELDPYPYSNEAIYYTYDGLHPSDYGSQIIANILADELSQQLQNISK